MTIPLVVGVDGSEASLEAVRLGPPEKPSGTASRSTSCTWRRGTTRRPT
ncbi:hypothetical protein SALBM217S_06801 [Streptomyces griseoloalbus]